MWWPWSSGSSKTESSSPSTPQTDTKNPPPPADFDPAKLPKREKLPSKLQKIVEKQDKDENFFDELVDDSNVRYAAYAARLRTILLSAHRYVAYTSDIGESFRPVAHPVLVRGAYGVSWVYILGDVSYEGYKAYWHNKRVVDPGMELTERQRRVLGVEEGDGKMAGGVLGKGGVVSPLEDYRTVMLQRGIFQSLASMGLPALTIHSVVRYSGRAMKDVKNVRVRTWAPIGLGLAVVPFLPSIFDKPVENAVEWVFHKGFEKFGGHEAVGDAPLIGREQQLSERPKHKKE
ncbi:mitochondrial fission process protein 1 [Staphylotrichum tortipilum]|uniref:Mitochondrial fission process protein 1 n=1 Tax=Staphylotrichum tortipilum TaxID=2831512 RepID=A0AAN6MEY4_9PEZI|nr:mitochondrial fission process protein 1 [Staphylotrichum longicolle]